MDPTSVSSAPPRRRSSTGPSSLSASIRPPASGPLRPPSAASIRPSSSAGSVRPSSSSGFRSESRSTQRPTSRYSHRPSSRQSSRLLQLYQNIVTQITGWTPDTNTESFEAAVDVVAKNLNQTLRPAGNIDMLAAEKQIKGYARRARINHDDVLADALSIAQKRLGKQFAQKTDLDAEIHSSRIPNHIHFLLSLSNPANPSTVEFAEKYIDTITNPNKPPAGLTWQDILAEEPYEGQHWEGVYGLPSGSTKEEWELQSEGSTPSLSPVDDFLGIDNEFIDTEDSSSSWDNGEFLASRARFAAVIDDIPTALQPDHSYRHRYDVEELQSRQYWRREWQSDAFVNKAFSIGDAATLGPTFSQLQGDTEKSVQEKFIHEQDVVREILMGLQGRRNFMISWTNIGEHALSFMPASDRPGVLHYTSVGLDSILMSFARKATIVEHLRKFAQHVFASASQSAMSTSGPLHLANLQWRTTRTLEAFSEAVDSQVRTFSSWCAKKEEEICKAQAGIGLPHIVTILSLEKAMRDEFSEAFSALLDIIRDIVTHATRSTERIISIWTFPDLPKRITPAVLAALILDSLLKSTQDYSSMGDVAASSILSQVLSGAVEPLWKMSYCWLQNGIPISTLPGLLQHNSQMQLAEEFFIEDNELTLQDPDFWEQGFVLRGSYLEDTSGSASIPWFLQAVSKHVLAAGKAVGLLRVLGLPGLLEPDQNERWMSSWQSFGSLLKSFVSPQGNAKVLLSAEGVSRLVYEELVASCSLAKRVLTHVLVDECDLWFHLNAMEDIYLMRKGDVISNLLNTLFARMDNHLPWDDFHFLNSAFADVSTAARWIDPSLVRFSRRGSRDREQYRTVRTIEGLFIEYAVPFPLTYIFGPTAMQTYSSIFVLAMQVRRAKSALEQIIVRNAVRNLLKMTNEMKMFYAMRAKLSWFVNTLLNYIYTNVLYTQVAIFHASFRDAASLDDMIELHNTHLQRMESGCFLQTNTASLHRALISVLDLTLHFCDCFIAFTRDTAHDTTHRSIIPMKGHRSRRLKRQRKNVIGFSQMLSQADDTSSSSDSDHDEAMSSAIEPSFSAAASAISFAEESFVVRLDNMSSELDALVRYIRRGVESLAAGTNEGASMFGIFSFALEDWDL